MTAKAKLTDDQVDEIRAIKAADPSLTNAELGRRFGVDASQISRLLNRKSRAEAQPEIPLAMIPWGRITPNIRNVRSSMSENTDEALADLEGLASSILDLGLLQPLRVEPIERRAEDGATYVLVDGHRRWRAMQLLVQRGKIQADEPVPVIIGGDHDEPADLTLEQLAANLARRAMHPLDEAEAFRRLVEGGVGTEAISRCVGRTQRYVQARLLLARRLGDPAKQALRDGAVTLAQAEALTDADAGQQQHVLLQIHRFPTEASIRDFLHPEKKAPVKPTREEPLPSVSEMLEGTGESDLPPIGEADFVGGDLGEETPANEPIDIAPPEANAVRDTDAFTPPRDWPNASVEADILKLREKLDGIRPHNRAAEALLADAMDKLYAAYQTEMSARLRRWRELGYRG